MGKYYACRGMEKVEVDADSIVLRLDDGSEFELHYRRVAGEVSLSVNGGLVIIPWVSNVVRLERKK